MSYNNKSNNHFLLGALMGGIIGGATGLLFAPKKGEDLRCDIADKYCQINDMTRNLTNKAKKMAHFGNNSHDDESMGKNFIFGIVAGSLVGATTAFLLAPKAGSQLRRDISNKYSELAENTQQFAHDMGKKTRMMARNVNSYTEDWKDLAGDIFDKISDNLSSNKRGETNLMDWLNIGVRVLQNFQKRR